MRGRSAWAFKRGGDGSGAIAEARAFVERPARLHEGVLRRSERAQAQIADRADRAQ